MKAAGAALNISVKLTHNNSETRGFWEDDWHEEHLRVIEYEIHCGGHFESAEKQSLLGKLIGS